MSNFVKINNKINRFNKKLSIDGDKSLSIRWALLSSQSTRKSKASNLLLSEDVVSTLNCLKKLGVKIKISNLRKEDERLVLKYQDYLKSIARLSECEIIKEINNSKLYREFKVDYKNYELDLRETSEDQNADSLMSKAKNFFKKNGLLLNWKEFAKLDEVQKINTLSMISPITNEEKQKLLEALTIKDKINTLEKIIDFYIHEVNFNNQTVQ